MTRTVFENEFIRQGILLGKEFRGQLASKAMDVPATVREFLTLTGMTQAQFAKRADIAQGTVSKWISGQQSPNKMQWDRVIKLIGRDSRTRHLIARWPDNVISVPVVSWVSAGKLVDASSQIPVEEADLLAVSGLGPGDYFGLRVSGDSMDRISPDGSIIVVNRADRELVPEKPYVFLHRGETTFKLWRANPDHLAPHSWGSTNKPIFLKGKKDFEVIGRVRRTVLDL